jgi:hypothetical protein
MKKETNKPKLKMFKAATKPEYVRDNATLKIYRVVPAPHLSDQQPIYCLKDIDGEGIYFVNETGLNRFTWGQLLNA